jgi:lipopolysaccharide export system protein LptA
LVTIESDRQQADNTTGIVTATGNVRIVYPDRKVLATSRQAQYFSREARVVLSGDVQVVQENGNRLLAEQVVYDVSQERVEARPFPGAQVLSIVRLKRSGGSSGTATDPQMQASPVLPAP